MRCIFVLGTGRSGTHSLYRLCRRNLSDAVCRHEPYLWPGNPNLFGAAIDARLRHDVAALRKLVERKRRYILRLGCSTYVETSHAFLKSYFDLAPEYFPDIGLFYLLRDPLKTARSEANREELMHRMRFPFRTYRAPDGQTYFRWSLTGHEPIYECFAGKKPTLFQHYFLQWIEIQNRAVQFLDDFAMHDNCAWLDSPQDLNAPGRLRDAFGRLGLALRFPKVRLTGGHNRNPGVPTVVTTRDRDEAHAVLEKLPGHYLEIFRRPQFARFEWTSGLLRRSLSAV